MPRQYDRLSDLDREFLSLEVPGAHMHIAGTATFEGGTLRLADGGLDIARIRSFVESRLSRIPRYRQVVAETPFGRPIWLDDPHFNIEYHVRHTSLPRPGNEQQLKALCGRIFSQTLDRSKPLWEVWIVDGVAGSDRFGFISKVHHAMVDGVRSIDLIEALLSTEPATEFEPPAPWIARRRPVAPMLMLDDLRRAWSLPLQLALRIPSVVRQFAEARSDARLALRGLADLAYKTIWRPSETPFNKPIGPHRRFDWLETSIADVKAIRATFAGSLNDVVLATMSGAVRRFLEHRRISPEGLEFRVMAPVSVATRTGRADELGNQVSAWMVPLPIGESDPRRRLEIIQRTTTRLKEEKNALGALLLTKMAGLTPATVVSLAARLPWRGLPFNMVVTNVPGPQQPLHLLGAKMLNYFGTVPITNYLGLGTAIVSYAGGLYWGFNADWDLVPDVDFFAGCVGSSFRELRESAR